MKRKGMRARWLQGVFLAVKERTQKETVYICPCWPEWAASNSFCYPALLPDGGWRPQKEVGSAETPASRWSHPTVRGPLRGGKRPNCFCQFEVKILSLESRVIFMDTIKFFLNCLVIWLIKKKINSHLSPQLDYMYLSFFFVSISYLLTVGFSVWRTMSAQSRNSGNIWWMNKCSSHGTDRWMCNKKDSRLPW